MMMCTFVTHTMMIVNLEKCFMVWTNPGVGHPDPLSNESTPVISNEISLRGERPQLEHKCGRRGNEKLPEAGELPLSKQQVVE